MIHIKRILVLLLTVALFSCTVITVNAAAPSEVSGRAGEQVAVDFTFENIAGIEGTFTFSDPDIIVTSSTSMTGFSGSARPLPGKHLVAYFTYPAVEKCTLTLILTISDKALAGQTCTITFEYETSDDGEDMNPPETVTVEFVVKGDPKIDFEALKEQIRIAESLVSTEYTSATWSVLKAAYDNAKKALNSTNQEGVDVATETLKNAIKQLEKIPEYVVDYSGLIKQIKIAEALKSKDYTSASWSKLTQALTKANEALKSTNQTEVNTAANNLKAAIAGLVTVSSNGIDYTELNRQIAIAEGLKEEDYTPETWTALESALSSAVSARGSNSQKVVDNAAAALKNAIAALVKLEITIDYTELEKQITIAEGLNEADYTDISWEAVANALESAKTATTSENQAEVDAAAATLKSAIAVLVRMNYTALNDAIAAVQEHADNEDLSALWKQMCELLDKAQELLNSGDQAAVDACAAELEALLAEIIAKIAEIKDANTVIVEKPVPTEPTDDYCNIGSHRVWPILFWISLSINVVGVVLFVVIFMSKRKKTTDDTPLVDYDIADDAE